MNDLNTIANDLMLNSEDNLGTEIEYIRLNTAARILSRNPEDLLHLGAIGKLKIIAGVIAKGEYEWLDEALLSLAYPNIIGPIKRVFGPADRVLLLAEDVAEIEATGSVIPHSFHAELEARQIVDKKTMDSILKISLERSADFLKTHELHEKVNHAFLGADNTSITDESWPRRAFLLDSGLAEKFEKHQPQTRHWTMSNFLKMVSFTHPWRMTHPFKKNVGRTTKNHLFISKKELERLKQRSLPHLDEMTVNQFKVDRDQGVAKIHEPPSHAVFNTLPASPAVQLDEGTIRLRERSNALTNIIGLAIDKAAPDKKAHEIWRVLIRMAKEPDPIEPLLRYENREIKYVNGESTGSLDFNKFRGRVARALEKRENAQKTTNKK